MHYATATEESRRTIMLANALQNVLVKKRANQLEAGNALIVCLASGLAHIDDAGGQVDLDAVFHAIRVNFNLHKEACDKKYS